MFPEVTRPREENGDVYGNAPRIIWYWSVFLNAEKDAQTNSKLRNVQRLKYLIVFNVFNFTKKNKILKITCKISNGMEILCG